MEDFTLRDTPEDILSDTSRQSDDVSAFSDENGQEGTGMEGQSFSEKDSGQENNTADTEGRAEKDDRREARRSALSDQLD